MTGNTVEALAWILREQLDASIDRLPGLDEVDARLEVRDLVDVFNLLVSMGAKGDEIDRMARELVYAQTHFG